MKSKLVLGALLASLVFSSNWVLADQKFGDGANMAKVIPLATLMTSPERYAGSQVTVEGKIVKVCQKRGCWVDLATENTSKILNVKVRDGDMVFPMAAMGKTAFATGTLTANKLSLDKTIKYLAHRAEENKEAFDPKAVTEPMVLYRLAPTGVTIND